MKFFTLKVCAYASLSLAAAGCVVGIADDEQGAETTGSSQDALSFTTKFSWSQGQVPTSMTSTSNSMCFLNHVQGQFNGWGEKVWIDAVSPGAWQLRGQSGSAGVAAWSYCVTGLFPNQISSTEYIWRQGEPTVNLGTASNRLCFLTRMEGRFWSNGEKIETFKSGGNWYLGGASSTQDVVAGARCVVAIPEFDYSWAHPQPTQPMGQTVDNRKACAITMVRGNFKTAGAYVQAKPEGVSTNLQWSLRGIATGTKALAVKGSCFF